MENVIVLYKSNTGFTQKYAEWIAEELGCKAVPLENMDTGAIMNHKTIIFGGGIHASHIKGFKTFRDKVLIMGEKDVVIFATGATPQTEIDLDELKRKNFLPDEIKRLQLFYFQSGMNYESMGMVDKGLMGLYRCVLKMTKEKTPVEQGVYDTISKSNDHSNKEFIIPLLEYVKSQNML